MDSKNIRSATLNVDVIIKEMFRFDKEPRKFTMEFAKRYINEKNINIR